MDGMTEPMATASFADAALDGTAPVHAWERWVTSGTGVLWRARAGHGAHPDRSRHIVGGASSGFGPGRGLRRLVLGLVGPAPNLDLAHAAGPRLLRWRGGVVGRLGVAARGVLPDHLQRLPAGPRLPSISSVDHHRGRGPHRPAVGDAVHCRGAPFHFDVADSAALRPGFASCSRCGSTPSCVKAGIALA